MAALETEIVFDPIFGARAEKKLVTEAKKLGKDAGEKGGDSFNKGFGDRSKLAFAATASAAVAAAAAIGAAFAVKSAVGAAAEFERINTQLEVLTGSAEKANKVFEDLKEFSAETPFKLQDIAQASAKLISFGFSAGTVKDRIKEIGEVAAGSGAELGDVALIFGQVAAAGKLTGERLLQLQERAIPIGPAIAKTLGIAESQLRDFVSQGKVTADVFQEAFRSLSASGGVFEGALTKQSQTISGALSTLSDNFSILQAEFGKAFGPGVVNVAQELSLVLQDIVKVVKDPAFQKSVVEGFGALTKILLIEPAKFWVDFFSGDKVAKTLGQINTELDTTQKQLKFAQDRLEKVKGNFFLRAISSIDGLKNNVVELIDKEQDLLNQRNKLIAQDSAAIRLLKEVGDADTQSTDTKLENIKRETDARLAAQKALGTIGLTQEQMLLERLEREQEIINAAEETKAISEAEANARRIQSLEAVNAQILALRSKSKEVEKGIDKTAENINKSMNQSLGNGVANGIQQVTQSLIQGENVFKAFGQAVLGLVADMAIQMGKIFVATGVAQLALFSTPGASILAGAALIAAGTVAKSIFGGGGSGSPGGVPGGGIASGGFVADSGLPDSTATDQVEEREEPSTQVALTINGDVLDSDETGLRIISLINNSFEKDGVVVKGAAFA